MPSKPGNKRHLLITGSPGCGKTTLLQRLAAHFSDLHPTGFYTEEIRVFGVRKGFRLVGLDGRERVLSHTCFREGPRVGRYRVDVQGFETFLGELKLVGTDTPLVFIDEIGRMECLSGRFVALIRGLFDSGNMVCATIALDGGGFITEVKGRKDCELITLTKETSSTRLAELCRGISDRLGKG